MRGGMRGGMMGGMRGRHEGSCVCVYERIELDGTLVFHTSLSLCFSD